MKKKGFCHYCGTKLTEKFIEGRIRLFCRNCDEPLYENPIPASAIVLVNKKEELLLVKRSVEPKKGFWCLPGGFMELRESPESCALRELKEETGLDGKIEKFLGLTTNSSPRYNTVLMMGYLVRNYEGDLIAGDDADDVGFFHPDSFPEIAFESHKRFVRIYYAGFSDH